MGTDITFFAEQQAADGTWHLADEPVENPYYDPENYPETATEPQIIPREIDIGRIYALFAILADIRNGVRCEEPFVPLSEPRGLPDDLSDIGRRYFDSWDGAYGESWLTPSEIEAYNWSQIIQRRAMVAPEAAHLFENNPLY